MYLKINTNEELLNFIETILGKSIDWIAIDTEFQRRDTYFPALSLIQIATLQQTFVIDVLANIDLQPLRKILENQKILKVLHAGDQDFDALNYKLNIKINPFIDTQVMATFASLGKALSLEKLVLHFLKIQMDKSLQDSNWLNRPLSDDQITYAARDAEYIAKIYQPLHAELVTLNRLSWVQAEMQNLFEKYTNPPLSKEWLKFCKPNQRYLQHLYAYVLVSWREKIAKTTNKARPLVIANTFLEYMIQTKNHTPYTEKFCKTEYLEDFLDTWHSIEELAKNSELRQLLEQEVNEHFAKISPEYKELLAKINSHINTIANDLNMPADVIMNKQQKLQAVKTNGESLNSWRQEMFKDLFETSYIIVDQLL
jgi:ribonuclease D